MEVPIGSHIYSVPLLSGCLASASQVFSNGGMEFFVHYARVSPLPGFAWRRALWAGATSAAKMRSSGGRCSLIRHTDGRLGGSSLTNGPFFFSLVDAVHVPR